MQKRNAVILMFALTLFFGVVLTYSPSPLTSSASGLTVDECSCTASDQTCSSSISCRGGCIMHCIGEGECYGECSGSFEMLATETTLQMQNGTYPQLVARLAAISGRDLAFSPTNPDVVFNADYKKAALWDVLEMLSNRGKVEIGGKDFEKLKRLRRTLLSDTRISICVGNTPVSTFVGDMAAITGLPLRISSGRPMAIVNAKLQNVTLNEILRKVSDQTGTKIEGQGEDPTAQ